MAQIGDNAKKILGFGEKTLGDQVVSPFTGKTYELKFIDDFEGDTLNEKNWSYDERNAQNGELQAYRRKNIVVRNGLLEITGKKEKEYGKVDGSDEIIEHEYTSGKIISRGKVEYQYGRFEMYGKLPEGQGMWPAFWTLGSKRGWPWGGEIDIMEMVGGDDQWGNKNRDGQNLYSLHWADPDVTPEDAWHTGKGTQHKLFGKYDLPGRAKGDKLGDEYHLYGVEWLPDRIIAYFDDQKVSEVDITDPTMREAYHQPHYMLINLAIGGVWALGFDWEGNYIHEDTLPQKLLVDWVKVWQEKK